MEKILYNLTVSNFWKWINYYKIQQFVYENCVLESSFLMVSAIKEFFSKIGNDQVVENLFPEKLIRDLLKPHDF